MNTSFPPRYIVLVLLSILSISTNAQSNVVFDATTKELGTLLWHSPRTVSFSVSNKGTSELTIKEVRTDCGCMDATWTKGGISPGGQGEIKVTYDAELLGHFNKGVAVYFDGETTPQYLKVMGNVSMTTTEPSLEYPFEVGDYFLSTDNIEFDDVRKGEMPTYTLNILNSGKKSYRPELMHLPKYLTAQADPAVIQPGRVGRIVLTLHSDELHNYGLTQTNVYLSRFMGDRVNKATEINVSATLLPDIPDTSLSQALAPKCVIDSTHIVIGPLGKKKKAKGELLIKNEGKTPLTINTLQVYNPGISVSVNKRRIDPGEEQKLNIIVNANNTYFKGRRRILLITNDPNNAKIVIDVTIPQNEE